MNFYPVLEEFLQEDAGEKASKHYSAKFPGIRDEFTEFDVAYKKHKLEQENEDIIKVKGVPIIKNPKNLNDFGPSVRGVITKNGDLYLAAQSSDIIHIDILDALFQKHIIKSKPRGWEEIEKTPNIDFITIRRVWNKNILGIGESYVSPKSNDIEGMEKYLSNFDIFIEAFRQKNPNIKIEKAGVKRIA